MGSFRSHRRWSPEFGRCSFAPLLFLVVAKILALAMQQDSKSSNITLPGNMNFPHLSTIQRCFREGATFASSDEQSETIHAVARPAGAADKKQNYPFEYSRGHKDRHGIIALRHGDTVRYLSYAVGTGELAAANWAARVRNVQQRLTTATRLATSVENRVLILNVIMLPDELFLAAVFKLPPWAEQQLRSLQKQFFSTTPPARRPCAIRSIQRFCTHPNKQEE